MEERRRALVIANGVYEDAGLRQLRSPAADADALTAVLGAPLIGGFEVNVHRDEPSYRLQEIIEGFFGGGRPDDLLLLHLSCHGMKSDAGDLSFAARNTNPTLLRSTAVPADFVNDCMSRSRARRIVLLLDCCYGGAFPRGAAVRAVGSVDVLEKFPRGRTGSGRGRAVITASTSMEYAFEGPRLTDQPTGVTPSVFTQAIVDGLLTGEADRDRDGVISLDELYDYVHDRVVERNPAQTPSRRFDGQGEIFIARSPRAGYTGPLPRDLHAAATDANPYTRAGSVTGLRRLLVHPDVALAQAALALLRDLAAQSSSVVADEARAALKEAERPEQDGGVIDVRGSGLEQRRLAPSESSPIRAMALGQVPEGASLEADGDALVLLPTSPSPAALLPSSPAPSSSPTARSTAAEAPPLRVASRRDRRRRYAVPAVAAVLTPVVVLTTVWVLQNHWPGSGSSSETGAPTLQIVSDLPMQGNLRDSSEATVNAMGLYLQQVGSKAGRFPIKLAQADDSTASAMWDSGQCQQNATRHVASTAEIAVVGTFNSGCSKIEVPILNKSPDGPMLMVSHGNTNPGLTKPWDVGEPGKYYPTGKRNYARVVATDDADGVALARFAAQDLGAKKVYVLHDAEIYGERLAESFSKSATSEGLAVTGTDQWDDKAANYTDLFKKVKAAGADAVLFSGIFLSNGKQLVKDKVAILGDNTRVKLLAPDGFTGYPEFTAMPEAQGAYLCFPGLSTDQLRAKGGAGARFLDAYKAKYGADPASSYALYAVAALQVILAAIQNSDGTRRGVTEAVLSGSGITIPAASSMLGREFHIDPKTGDIDLRDITIEVVRSNQETFLKVIPA